MEEQKKSVRIPNYIRNLVYITEKISLSWATKLVLYFFFKPVKFPTPKYELPALEAAEKVIIEGPGGKNLQLYRWGEGPIVLLTHGWSGRGTQLGLIALELAKAGYQVISFDGPAHGISEGSKTDLLQFIESIRIIKIKYPKINCYVGHSLGGLASLHAAQMDESIKKVAVIGTPNKISEIVDNFCRMVKASPKVADRIKQHIESVYEYELHEYDSEAAIPGLKERKGLILHDDDDYDVPIHNAREMREAWGANSELIITHGLGHRRILRDPEAITEVVNFVNG